MVNIPIADYRPDVSSLNGQFTDQISNVLLADGSVIPFPALGAYTAALSVRPLSGFMARQTNGTISIFAGSAEKLWLLDNTDLTWTDVSQAATTYNANIDNPWDFAQFGSFVVAVNANDDPQVFELGVDTKFADLAGSPPRASQVRVWGDFLALMGLTSNPGRVQWSALNDIEGWTPGTDNSDYQDFPDGGRVQGSTDATNPIIFQQSAIRRATFVPGSIEIFTFQKIHELRGAKSPASVATRGSFAFYIDEGGFFQIGADGGLTPIGFEKVDRTVFSSLNAADVSKIRGKIDPFYSRVYWAVDASGDDVFDTLYIYDWNLGRWTKSEASFVLHFPAATTGQTIESLDDVSASLDALAFSLDSKVWQGGAPVLAAFDADYKLGFFSGSNMAATITSQEIGDTAGQVSTVTEVYPIVDESSVTVQIGSRLRRTDSTTWTTAAAPSANTGKVRKRSRGRFHRFRLNIDAGEDWNHAQGFDVKWLPSGQR